MGRHRANCIVLAAILAWVPLTGQAGFTACKQQFMQIFACQSLTFGKSLPGITNEDGAWITPAFQLHVAKMDLLGP